MPKAKLDQIAHHWVDENNNPQAKTHKKEKNNKSDEQPKKKQTFSLKVSTINQLWAHRIRTSKPISKIIDDLVSKHIPKQRIK